MLFEFGVTLGKMGHCCVLVTQLGEMMVRSLNAKAALNMGLCIIAWFTSASCQRFVNLPEVIV